MDHAMMAVAAVLVLILVALLLAIGTNYHSDRRRTNRRLDAIGGDAMRSAPALQLERIMERFMADIREELAKLRADVERFHTANAGATALILGFKDQLAAVRDAGTPADVVQAVTDLHDALGGEVDALAAAVAANTQPTGAVTPQAAPAPPTTPAP